MVNSEVSRWFQNKHDNNNDDNERIQRNNRSNNPLSSSSRDQRKNRSSSNSKCKNALEPIINAFVVFLGINRDQAELNDQQMGINSNEKNKKKNNKQRTTTQTA